MSITGRSLNRKEEITYLRDSLERWLSSASADMASMSDVVESHAEKLALLKALDDTHDKEYQWVRVNLPKEFQREYPVFSATLEYGATGEGRLMLFMAHRAQSKSDFLAHVCGTIGGYFAQGVDIFDGLPPADNYIYRQLVSAGVDQFLKHEVTSTGHWSGHVDIFLQQYANYS